MSGHYRCKKCGHTPRRRVTSTSKKAAESRQHKKPCHCDCHAEALGPERAEVA